MLFLVVTLNHPPAGSFAVDERSSCAGWIQTSSMSSHEPAVPADVLSLSAKLSKRKATRRLDIVGRGPQASAASTTRLWPARSTARGRAGTSRGSSASWKPANGPVTTDDVRLL